MNFEDLLEIVKKIKKSSLRLYLIVRNLKESIKPRDPVLDKYTFTAFQVEIVPEIKDFFKKLTEKQLAKLIADDSTLHEYDPITDSTQKTFTYQMTNKALSFSDVVVNQLEGDVKKLKSLEDVFGLGELWAYCVGFPIDEYKTLYTFRKTSETKVAVDTAENPETNQIVRKINAWFNTDTKKLEMLHGQLISMDKKLDCLFYDSVFYVTQKSNFEHIVGISQEFKETSMEFVNELDKTKQFVGLDLLRKTIEEKPTIHRKLTRLAKLQNHKNIDATAIKNMKAAAKLEGHTVRIKDGKFQLESDDDIDLMIRLLSEYYKEGLVFKKKYGSYSGKLLNDK